MAVRNEWRIGLDEVGDLRVSTVLLPAYLHLPYETMVFRGSWADLYCDRYLTVEEARAGHARVVAMARAGEFDGR